MALHDDGDIIHALGFVSVYSAYLEDEVAEIIKIVKHLKLPIGDIERYRLIDQARQLSSMFKKLYRDAPDFDSKDDDEEIVLEILADLSMVARLRNEALHSVYISEKGGGNVLQKNPRGKSRSVQSKEFYLLADDIFTTSNNVHAIRSYIRNLIQVLKRE